MLDPREQHEKPEHKNDDLTQNPRVPDKADLSSLPKRIGKFLFVAATLKAVCECDASWETKHLIVFSDEVKRELSETGIEVGRHSFGSSYEENTRAFVDAVIAKGEDLAAAFADLPPAGAGLGSISRLSRNIGTFLRIADEVKAICDSEASWETKYDLIFSETLKDELKQTGIEIRWYDPDLDYEDDVRAYVKALTEKAEELRKTGLCAE